MTDIGRAIRDARRDQRLTIKQLAELAGLDETTVGRIELGKTENPRSADTLQRVLGIGIYKPAEPDDGPRDPRLSEATFSELLGALATTYGRDIRAAAGARIDAIDELPPDVLARARNGTIPSGRLHPNEGNSTD